MAKKKNKPKYFFIILIVIALAVLVFAFNSKQINFEKNSCPEGIIPENVNFLHGIILFEGEDSYAPFFKIQGSWTDGKGMENSLEYGDGIATGFFKGYDYPTNLGDCVFGQKNGENVNYLYCVPKIYTSDKILDKEGNIIETNVKYKVYLILEPLAEINWEDHSPAYSKFQGAEGDYEIKKMANGRNVILNTKVVSSKCERIK
jgi:hypothetical protein